MQAIYQSVKAVLIVTGREGSYLIPKMRDGLKIVTNLKSVVVFCGEAHVKLFKKKWQNEYDIVKMVTSDFEELLPEIGKLLDEAAQAEVVEEF